MKPETFARKNTPPNEADKGPQCHLDLNTDGNLVLFGASNRVLWASNKHDFAIPPAAYSVTLSEDGDINLTAAGNPAPAPWWSSNTRGILYELACYGAAGENVNGGNGNNSHTIGSDRPPYFTGNYCDNHYSGYSDSSNHKCPRAGIASWLNYP